jgi:hypothetical protein
VSHIGGAQILASTNPVTAWRLLPMRSGFDVNGMWTSAEQDEAPMREAITGIDLVAFGTIAVLALCIGVCALADAIIRVVTWQRPLNFAVAILTLASAILAALYVFVRDVPPQLQQQSYRRHRPWNFK